MSPCVSHTHENQSTSYFWRRGKIKSLVSFLSEIDTWITQNSSAENDRFYCKNAVNILISWHDTPFVPSCGYEHWSGFHFFSTKPRMTHPQLDVFSWLHCSMINSSLLQCQIATERGRASPKSSILFASDRMSIFWFWPWCALPFMGASYYPLLKTLHLETKIRELVFVNLVIHYIQNG